MPEMASLQGVEVPGMIDPEAAGVSTRVFAGMVGNGMPINTLCRLLPRALQSAGLATAEECELMIGSRGWQ